MENIRITRSKSKTCWYANAVGRELVAYQIDNDGDALISNSEVRRLNRNISIDSNVDLYYISAGEFVITDF